jgi:hypothetical protein
MLKPLSLASALFLAGTSLGHAQDAAAGEKLFNACMRGGDVKKKMHSAGRFGRLRPVGRVTIRDQGRSR